jgi:hypothetical protein
MTWYLMILWVVSIFGLYAVVLFKRMGTTVTDQNLIQEEVK